MHLVLVPNPLLLLFLPRRRVVSHRLSRRLVSPSLRRFPQSPRRRSIDVAPPFARHGQKGPGLDEGW